jgi:catechol 2,3-dioxygenase-like lactoylglutathione lyase family enzyme
MNGRRPKIARLARFSLTTADVVRATNFYEAAFGCRILAVDRVGGPEFESGMGVTGGASRTTLGLGPNVIELLQFDTPGASYPAHASASDLMFQHFAIVVSDIAKAYRNLSGIPGWMPISRDGPQTLPPSSGGVTAFKFRDPEGHPLEFLEHAEDRKRVSSSDLHNAICLGIDHSAISVRDSTTTIAFYERLGLCVSARSYNHGLEQETLDNLFCARVDVTALQAPAPAPHLELLCYHNKAHKAAKPRRSNDIASTRLVFEPESNSVTDIARWRIESDPDCHNFQFME